MANGHPLASEVEVIDRQPEDLALSQAQDQASVSLAYSNAEADAAPIRAALDAGEPSPTALAPSWPPS